jgi:hypothetical protein
MVKIKTVNVLSKLKKIYANFNLVNINEIGGKYSSVIYGIANTFGTIKVNLIFLMSIIY